MKIQKNLLIILKKKDKINNIKIYLYSYNPINNLYIN